MTCLCSTAFVLSDFLFSLLLALVGILTVAVCVVAGMIAQRHNADMRMLKKHVYTRETWTKTTDCANNAKTENKKSKENGAPQKLRHGKKNKLNKTQNEANK